MLFNSYEFLFFFLPAALLGYFGLGCTSHSRLANLWLVLASLFFYAWWDISFLPILLVSIAMNYIISGRILHHHAAGAAGRERVWFWLGVCGNLGLLCYYKYLGFVLRNLARAGLDVPLLHVVLPLGISFFTITQLLYLYDCHLGNVDDHDPLDYALFVSFFPHLLAGPILYHRQMMRQFRDARLRRPDGENMTRGFLLFLIGLTKKVVIADAFLPVVTPVFIHPEGATLTTAWLAAICYAFELFFDFSGYSDMAVGLARMMNLQIPVNFKSPFRATSLINFWQRWHISLTNALTVLIYTPIMQQLRTRTVGHMLFASAVTLFLVGIWHGAGWTFIAFALLHTIGIIVNHAWKYFRLPMHPVLGHALLLLFLLVTLVFFRAPGLKEALQMLYAMAGGYNVDPGLGYLLLSGTVFPKAFPVAELGIAVALVTFAPASQDIVKRLPLTRPVLAAAGIALAWCILHLEQFTTFLYFQF